MIFVYIYNERERRLECERCENPGEISTFLKCNQDEPMRNYPPIFRSRFLALVSSCLLLFALMGCGGDGNGDTSDGDGDETEQTASGPTGSATINGTVHFEGTAPERSELETNRECRDLRESPALSQNVVVNDNGTLKWTFVYIKEGLEDETYSPPSEPVVLDQDGCMYKPHMLGVQTNQPILIRNSDPFQHNVNSMAAENNRGWNFSQPVEGMETEETFQQPEVMIRIKCDVHGWMEAWAGVVGHPFHSQTGEEGSYSLDNLPAGEYVVEAWHEEYGTQTETVTVKEDTSASVDFTFDETMAETNDGSDMPVVTWVVSH